MKLSVPTSDSVAFAKLPEEVRREVRLWLRYLAPVVNCGRGKRVESLHAAATRAGVSYEAARGKFYAYDRNGWRALVNKSKAKEKEAGLPAEIIETYRTYCERNQRKNKPAWKALIREWRAGHLSHLPWPAINPETDLPTGCSYENLNRFAPSNFELAAARHGRSAAANYRPMVFRTRKELQVGQFYLFDDIWHDHKVHVEGQRQARRPLEFHCLDLFSGCKFAWGIKAQMENIETGRIEHLKEREMRFLTAGILGGMTSIGLQGGYHPAGCTLIVEHGTAAIPEELESLIYDLTGGAVKTDRSGIEGKAAFAGQYAGRGKGNFRFKASLESLGNPIHNEMAYLAGQMGSNARLNGPEEIAGREKAHDALAKALLALPAEQASLLRFPFLELTVFRQIAAAIYQRLNTREDHELEGWIEAGLVAHEFRLSTDQPWLGCDRLLALPADQQMAIGALVGAGNYLSRVRNLQPLEVYGRGLKTLARLAPHQVALLLGRDLGVERRASRGMIEFEDQETGPGIYRFLARLDGQQLPDGERYLTVFNPMDDQHLHLFDAKGRWLGQCDRWNSISHADTEALQRQCGRVAKIEAELLYPVARRGAELTRRRIEDSRHNAAVLAGVPVTKSQKARAEELTAIARELEPEEIAAVLESATPAGSGQPAFSHAEISDLFASSNDEAGSEAGSDDGATMPWPEL
jgi:hypothetical protein